MIKRILHLPFLIRLFNWEYWPSQVLYGPLYIYWAWLGIRARSFFFFSTSNPGIHNSGFLMESKKQIYDLLPVGYYPMTVLFKAGTDSPAIVETIKMSDLTFPLIGKPDIGLQGLSVDKLNNERELIDYASRSRVDFLIQQFIPFEKEVGIFYYRFHGQRRGQISGMVLKEFLEVLGDGKSTIIELLKRNKRYILQLSTLKKAYGERLEDRPALGERRVLVPYGNHARGAKFLDVTERIDEQLTDTISKICDNIDGFHFGRLDIRFNSWEELRQGKNLSIIELNGAGSIPAHIYDPRHSIIFAWKEIIRHWNILWNISRLNHHHYKLPYMGISSGMEMLRQNREHMKLISLT